jgi:Na+-translocating ferredoxin:NAD+ oxidoreductase RnfG subunit
VRINKDSYIFSSFFTIITTIILVFPLTLANVWTKPTADDYWRVQRYVKTLKSLGLTADATKPEEARKQYQAIEKWTVGTGKQMDEKGNPIDVNAAYIAKGRLVRVSDEAIDKAEVAGYPITPLLYITTVNGDKRFAGSFTGPGLWGDVSLALGVNENASQIAGVQVLYQVETPGLGGRISEAWFTNQFSGLKPGPEGVDFNISGAKKSNGFDAIAGATITSTAVKDIISNRALPSLKALIAKIGGAQ